MRRAWMAIAALALPLGAAGCGNSGNGYHEVTKGVRVADQPHEHEHGPHGGHLVELGQEEHHAEVVFDQKAQKVVVYVLDSSAKKAEPIVAKQITLTLNLAGKPTPVTADAAPETGDPKGRSSRFEAAGNPAVKANVKDEEDLKGSVAVTIGGKSYVGEIKHEH